MKQLSDLFFLKTHLQKQLNASREESKIGFLSVFSKPKFLLYRVRLCEIFKVQIFFYYMVLTLISCDNYVFLFEPKWITSPDWSIPYLPMQSLTHYHFHPYLLHLLTPPARDKAYCRVFMIVLPYYIPLFYSLLLFYVRHHYI